MTEDKNIETANADELSRINPPTLTFDCELFDKHLDESDLSDAQKREFLETLWSIVVSFVDLGFGVHPLQQVMENTCEQQAEIAKFGAENNGFVVSSSANKTPMFNASADQQSSPSKKGDTNENKVQ